MMAAGQKIQKKSAVAFSSRSLTLQHIDINLQSCYTENTIKYEGWLMPKERPKIKVLIADQQPLFRQGVRASLNQIADVEISG